MALDKITLSVAKELVDKAIALRGKEFIYQRGRKADCMYVHHDEVWNDVREDYEPADNGAQPGCLVGLALSLHGVPLESMEDHEGTDATGLLEALENDNVVTYDGDAARFLYRAQVAQDRGESWGFARGEATGLIDDEKFDN